MQEGLGAACSGVLEPERGTAPFRSCVGLVLDMGSSLLLELLDILEDLSACNMLGTWPWPHAVGAAQDGWTCSPRGEA